MSALRASDDCDLYVYESSIGWICCEQGGWGVSVERMAAHIQSHVDSGAQVPDDWRERLVAEDEFIKANS